MANNIGPDGLMQVYPDGQGTQVYLKDNFDKNIFNISFGGGSHLPFTQKKEGNLTYFSTTGSPISYNSGAAPGRSVRIDVYPGGGMWGNKTNFSWKSNPGYLYNDKGIKNTEFTIIARPGKALGTQQSFCGKIGGRDEDALRSLIEMGYTDAKHSSVYLNYNYAHFPYVHAKINILSNPPKFTPGKWAGLKVIRIVAADNKSVHWEMWYDDNPIDAQGNPTNNWKKAAEFEDRGCPEYGNTPCTWKCHKDLCRIDGFESVDFALVSDREIDPTGAAATTPVTPAKPVPPGTVVPPKPKPVPSGKPVPPIADDKETADDATTVVQDGTSTIPPAVDVETADDVTTTPVPVEDDDNSTEEVQDAKDWIKANPEEAKKILGTGVIDPLLLVDTHDKICTVAKVGLSPEAVMAWIKANIDKAKQVLPADVVAKVTTQTELHS